MLGLLSVQWIHNALLVKAQAYGDDYLTFLSYTQCFCISSNPCEAVTTLHANKTDAIHVEGSSQLVFVLLWVTIVPMSIPVKTFSVRYRSRRSYVGAAEDLLHSNFNSDNLVSKLQTRTA